MIFAHILIEQGEGILMTGAPDEPDNLPSAEPASNTRRRPQPLIVAGSLLLLAALPWLALIGGFTNPRNPSGETLLLVVYLVAVIRTFKGGRIARLVTSVAAVLLIVLFAPISWLGFTDPNIPTGDMYALITIMAMLMTCAGVALLFVPSSNAHFRTPRQPSR